MTIQQIVQMTNHKIKLIILVIQIRPVNANKKTVRSNHQSLRILTTTLHISI